MWTDPGVNLGLHDYIPTTNRQSQGWPLEPDFLNTWKQLSVTSEIKVHSVS
jgi:hypothetical protein